MRKSASLKNFVLLIRVINQSINQSN